LISERAGGGMLRDTLKKAAPVAARWANQHVSFCATLPYWSEGSAVWSGGCLFGCLSKRRTGTYLITSPFIHPLTTSLRFYSSPCFKQRRCWPPYCDIG